METISLQILNPKVKDILQNLSELNLIRFEDENSEKADSRKQFLNVVDKIKSNINQNDIPSMDEIQTIVKEVRKERNDG